MKTTDLTRRMFWATATIEQKRARLAFYRRTSVEARSVAVAKAGPFVLLALIRTPNELAKRASYCPFEIEPPLIFTDPSPIECRRALRELFAPAHHRGSWYHAEQLESVLHALEHDPRPERCPGVPELPQYLLDVVPRSTYQARLLVAEAHAYLNGHDVDPGERVQNGEWAPEAGA